MSGHGFHVHGPHDHAVEHAGQGHGGGDGFSGKIAVMTAVLATVGAMFGYEGGATQNDAAMFKNNAAIEKTKAANTWNYYQAKSGKQNLAELAMTLPGVDPEKYKAEVARYKLEKADIKKEAEKLDAVSEEWNKKSDQSLHTHHQWALATTAEQIAISLAAITLLTKRSWMMYATIGVAIIGFALGAFAWLHIDPIGDMMGATHAVAPSSAPAAAGH